MTPRSTQEAPLSRTVPAQRDQTLYAPTAGEQRTARIMGAWFLGTFVFSAPAFWFYDPLLSHASYVVGNGEDTRVAIGALLEVLLAISGIATAVVIFPIVKRVNESVALGYIATRIMESVLIVLGLLSLMAVVDLRQDSGSGNDNAALVDVARSLLAVHNETALLGPQFCAGLGNGILLGYLMWRSRLLPRPMVMVGLIGGPLALLAGVRGAAGRLGHPRRTSRRTHRPRGHLGVLAQRLAPDLGLPAVTDSHRATGSNDRLVRTSVLPRSGVHAKQPRLCVGRARVVPPLGSVRCSIAGPAGEGRPPTPGRRQPAAGG
jgi:hypothetical protein